MKERLVTNKGQCVACIGCIEESNCKAECGAIDDCLEKLAEYETAEEEGRLVILPKCNIGDKVYIPIVFQNKIYTGEIEGFEYAKMRNTWVAKIRTDDGKTCYEAFEDFGKTVFFSREEAEKALDEMEKSD